ncbi:MAG TPA: prenyltransferase/squalene oxidase repeat-containing protein [Gemmataceae bacterium]|nr:prenyltransferase/squalene oxidase repeat-containing protein [Gemmataceae bacterium]
MEPYLLSLTLRLADGISRLPAKVRARHADYLRAAQNADGGFSGREGGSDLYYTGFALRGLAVLDSLTPAIAERAGDYLRGCLTQQTSVIDFFSLLYSCVLVQLAGGPDVLAGSSPDWPDRVAEMLERFRTSDGGYAKTIGSASGSTYHTFLVALCYQLLGRQLPRLADVVRFVASRRREDGGYVEIAPMRRGGTNPTAAAVGLLQLAKDEMPQALEEVRGEVIAFLAGMASPEGGLRANGRAPLADLLSTFTAAWTLEQLGGLQHLDEEQLWRYAESLERPEGGFHGGLWDEGHDVEYTFYGLGVLALLAVQRDFSDGNSV